MTQVSQHLSLAMAARLVFLLLPSVALSQNYEPVKLGEIIHNLIFPQSELVGGFERVANNMHMLDTKHLGCGKRQVCEAMSIGAAIERSDGSVGFEKGFLRNIVDNAGEAVFEVARPFLQVLGFGAVARQEVSFTRFVIDMIDSAIISFTEFIAGRRFTRQLDVVSPVATFIDPAAKALSFIPTSYYGPILDFVVDVTGIANRGSGAYGLMRSGGLGYFYGGGDSSICTSLQSDLRDDPYCDDAGAFFPLGILNPLNKNELGKTIRVGGDGINPLMDRTHNPNAMQHTEFEWADLLQPTKMLCKVDNVMNAVNGHILVTEDPEQEPTFISVDDFNLEPEYENVVEVRKNNEVVSLERLAPDEKQFVKMMNMYEKRKRAQAFTKDGMVAIARKETSKDKFDTYCQEENRKIIEKILKSKNVTVGTEETNNEEGSGEDYEDGSGGDATIISVGNEDEKSADDLEKKQEMLTDLLTNSRLLDHSLLSVKLDIKEGSELAEVKSLVKSFNIQANGRIEKVVKIDSKKGTPSLLIQFDSTKYRDAVLKGSRSQAARSSNSARLRKPKLKDLYLISGGFKK